MNVRCHLAVVFVLDKSHGSSASSLACKETWTDRQGAEYAWWHNAETRPGTGYPRGWEDQSRFPGGWERSRDGLALSSSGRLRAFLNIFHDPSMPVLDDYYEPWDYARAVLRDREDGPMGPALPLVSLMTGEPVVPTAGPNWDDELAGSARSADRDPNLAADTANPASFFELPRICNQCLNPSCVAACPSGATYKRGEDGLVLIDQERCRSWRSCVPACPYKKVYFNWSTGKSEKCHLCYPLTENGQASVCCTASPGGDQYLGLLLYDADRIREAAEAEETDLVDALRSVILDPADAAVVDAARRNGISGQALEAAARSPVYRFLVEWRLALPLHPEWRTLPMAFYVPPLVYSRRDQENPADAAAIIDRLEVPVDYLASLFAAGNQTLVRSALMKLLAVRHYAASVRRLGAANGDTLRLLAGADCSQEEAESIWRLLWATPLQGRVALPGLRTPAVGSTGAGQGGQRPTAIEAEERSSRSEPSERRERS